jgi:hypothetical protein
MQIWMQVERRIIKRTNLHHDMPKHVPHHHIIDCMLDDSIYFRCICMYVCI